MIKITKETNDKVREYLKENKCVYCVVRGDYSVATVNTNNNTMIDVKEDDDTYYTSISDSFVTIYVI